MGKTGLEGTLPANNNTMAMDHTSCIADYQSQRMQEMAGKTPDSCMIEAPMKKKAGQPMPAVRPAPSKSPMGVQPTRHM